MFKSYYLNKSKSETKRTYKMNRENKRVIDMERHYIAICPEERARIIALIDEGPEYALTNATTQDPLKGEGEYLWWRRRGTSGRNKNEGKHHPTEEEAVKIWMLGDGTFEEIKQKYIEEYGFDHITDKAFRDYFREMVKQKILV